MRTIPALLALALLAVTGCSGPEPEATPSQAAPSSPAPDTASCAEASTAPASGAAPVIDCIYPDPTAYLLCTQRTQKLPLELRWATVNADQVFIAYGEHEDAEPTAFTGPLPPVGTFDDDGALRHDCGTPTTAYTITAKGAGGITSEVFHLQTRLP